MTEYLHPATVGTRCKGTGEKGLAMEVSHMNEVFGLDLKAWERWVKYRKDIRKTYKSADSVELAQKKLASFGDQQMQAVENSIANGWTGLFPPPKEKAVFKAQQTSQRESRDFEELQRRAVRIGFRGPFKGEDFLGYKTLVERAEHNYAMSRPKKSEPVSINALFGRLA